jgi:hypothetical protein
MTRLLRADDVPAISRVDYWRHVVDETLGPLDLQLSSGPDLRDELLVGDAGGTWVPGAVARDIGSSSGSSCPAYARPGWTTRTRRRSCGQPG